MKTKPLLLATAGSTVDGRNIDDQMLEQMTERADQLCSSVVVPRILRPISAAIASRS